MLTKRKIKIAHLVSPPIQYFVPLCRALDSPEPGYLYRQKSAEIVKHRDIDTIATQISKERLVVAGKPVEI